MPEGFFGHFLNENYYEVAAVEAAGYYKFANRDQNEASLRCLQEAELIIAASETASCDSGRDPLEAARVQSRQRLSSAREICACNPGRFLSVATPFCSTRGVPARAILTVSRSDVIMLVKIRSTSLMVAMSFVDEVNSLHVERVNVILRLGRTPFHYTRQTFS